MYFRCCVYLAELEHTFFSHNSGYHSFPTRLAPPSSSTEKADMESFEDLFRYTQFLFKEKTDEIHIIWNILAFHVVPCRIS